jgi:hypothetical protein
VPAQLAFSCCLASPCCLDRLARAIASNVLTGRRGENAAQVGVVPSGGEALVLVEAVLDGSVIPG